MNNNIIIKTTDRDDDDWFGRSYGTPFYISRGVHGEPLKTVIIIINRLKSAERFIRVKKESERMRGERKDARPRVFCCTPAL